MSDGRELATDLASEGLHEGAVFAGRFRIERRLGKGGMGVVVAARHLKLDTPVAIKLLLPGSLGSGEAVTRFLREARAAARLRSEHVARITDVDALPTGEPFVVMEYLSGRDLASVLEERGPLPVRDAVDYVIQASDAIAEAHALGIVHRDLKPGNLFLTRRPDGSPLVKVLDFGVAKAPHSGDSEELTGTHAMLGSPLYMSPEQIVSARDVDSRTDVWALGTILYELVCGRPPFVAPTLQDLARQIMTEPPRPPTRWRPDLPAPFVATILECLTRDPAQRVQNVGELAEALAPFASPESLPLVASIKRLLAAGVTTGTQSTRAPVGVFASRERSAPHAAAPPAPPDFASTAERAPTEPAAAAADALADTAALERTAAVARPPVAAAPVSPYDPTEENLLSDSERKTRVQLRPAAPRSRTPLLVAGLVVVAVGAAVVGVASRSTTAPAVRLSAPDAAAVSVAEDAGVARASAADASPVTPPATVKAAALPEKRPAAKPPVRRKPDRKAPPARKAATPYDSRR